MDMTPEDCLEITRPFVAMSQHLADRIILVSGPVLIFCEVLARYFKPKSQEAQLIARIVQDALDNFRNKTFRDVPENEPPDNNRVTLFEYRECQFAVSSRRGWFRVWPWGWGRWPWSGWLIVVARSGHLSKTATSAFLAPDNPAHAEGVSGMIWRNNSWCKVANLPDINRHGYVNIFGLIRMYWNERFHGRENEIQQYNQMVHDVETYARTTKTQPHMVWDRLRRGKRSPKMICGLPIEGSDGLWGILVLDSSNDHDCIGYSTRAFSLALSELTKSLKSCGIVK